MPSQINVEFILQISAIRSKTRLGEQVIHVTFGHVHQKGNPMTVNHLLDYQIAALVEDITHLDNVGGSDAAALQRIRNTVYKSLMSGGPLDVITGALGQIEFDSTAKRFMQIVNYCTEHYRFEDRMVSAIVLPVSIRLQGVGDKQLKISQGDPGALRCLAAKMTAKLGARKIVFDNNLYQAESLYAMKARDLRAYLLQIEAGVQYPCDGPEVYQLCAQSDAPWTLAYFLGVEVIEPNRYPELNDWNVQLHSRAWIEDIGSAIHMSEALRCYKNADKVQTKGLGAHYFLHGLDAGAKAVRSLRIIHMLESMETYGADLHIYCNLSDDRPQVRTLMTGPTLTLEHKWELLENETFWDFQRHLESLANEAVPEFDSRRLIQLDMDTYSDQAIKHQVPLFTDVAKPA